MAKTHLAGTDEARGQVPSCTGAKLEIVKVERTKTSERSKTPGCLKYVPEFKVLEPKGVKGMHVWDHRIVIGNEEDPRGKKAETWDNQEGGPGRLKRLLVRSGTPISDDDEEWMEAAEGNIVVAPLVADPEGTFGTAPGLYYRETDDDCPPIAIATEDGKGRGKGKGAAAASRKARARTAADDDEDVEGEDEEEEKETTSSKSSSKAGKKSSKADDEDDDEDEEDEDEPAPKKARGKATAGRGKKAEEDEDDEEDDED